MELVEPSVKYKNSFIAAVREYQNDDGFDYRTKKYRTLSVEKLEKYFDDYVEGELSHSRGENLPEGYVPCSEYWLVDDGEFIGRATIRHELNDKLKQLGGHIGYDIRPTMRGRGYGNRIMALALEKAKALGISRALVTCDIRNVPSRRIIEKNGGVLQDQVENPDSDYDQLRFWVDTK